MAIVRTTSKETGTTGSAPPSVRPKAPDNNASRLANGRAMSNRAVSPANPANSGQFLADTRKELSRVVWPTREEVRSGTIVTIGLLLFFALYIFGLDLVAERFLMFLFSS